MATKDGKNDKHICCSFCNKPQDQASKLIAGPGVFICDECVNLCMSILNDESALNGLKKNKKIVKDEPKILPKPKEIKHLLDEYVVGQD